MPRKPEGRIYNDITERSRHAAGANQSFDPKDQAIVLAKCEFFNPCIERERPHRRAMIEAASARARSIARPSSSNPPAENRHRLAFVCAAKGYKLLLTMPESMSIERRNLLKALGAPSFLTPAADGMKGAIAKAEELVAKEPKAYAATVFQSGQSRNSSRNDGEELWTDTNGHIDMIVAGVGTGAHSPGVGEVIKQRKPGFKAIAVEPTASRDRSETARAKRFSPADTRFRESARVCVQKIFI